MNYVYDICGVGGSIVDQQFKVTPDIIEKSGLELNEMRLASPQEHSDLLKLLYEHNCEFISACGGSATNTIVAASYFGSKTHQLCSVANDKDGKTFLESLTNAGVSYETTNHLQETLPTAKCIVLVTPDGKRTMSTCLGISSCFNPNHLNLTAVSQSKYVYIEGYMATDNNCTVLSILNEAKLHNSKVVISLSDPWVASTFRNTLLQWCDNSVNLIFCNEAEAQAFTDTTSLEEAQEKLKKLTQNYVITCGEDGAICFDGNLTLKITAPKVIATDTNGAGDIFAGAFLHRIITGSNFWQAGKFAAEVASKLVQHFGARLAKEDYLRLENSYSQVINH